MGYTGQFLVKLDTVQLTGITEEIDIDHSFKVDLSGLLSSMKSPFLREKKALKSEKPDFIVVLTKMLNFSE